MAAATAAVGRGREISGELDLGDMAPRILVFSLAEALPISDTRHAD